MEEYGCYIKKGYILYALTLVLVLYSANVFGATIHVPQDQPTIQAGIDAASDGDTVLVANGTYIGAGNKNLDLKGKAITLQSENAPESTIIDCEGDGRGFYFHSGEGTDTVVSGFTIKNGFAIIGGGIYFYKSSPTIVNCIVANNWGFYVGGGMVLDGSSPIIINSSISGNKAKYNGGGFNIHDGSAPIIANSMITNNSATWGWGGAFYLYSSSPTITDSIISENSARFNGGAFNIYSYSSPVITNSLLRKNTAIVNGGAFSIEYSSTATITNCVISGNSAGDSGGGIDSVYSSYPTITNCTITGNTASSYGGGIFTHLSASQTVTNSIIWGNTASDGAEIYTDGTSSATVIYSDVNQNGYAGINDNIRQDPIFVDVTDPDPAKWDLHLDSTSPCIDAGLNNTHDKQYTDFDGDLRILDGDNDENLVIDMGADEFINKPVKIFLTSNNPVISSGETLDFQAVLTNQTDGIQTIYFVSFITLTDGRRYPVSGWLFGPYEVTVNPYEKISANISQFAPTSTPLGLYVYHGGYIEEPNSVEFKGDYFEFIVK